MATYPTDTSTPVNVKAGASLTGNTELRKEALDQNLRLRMTLDDVFASFQSEVITDTDGVAIPDAIFLNIGAEAPKGSNSITMGMVLPLTGDATIGDKYIPGTETNVSLAYFKMYFGEYANAVAEQTFGRIKNEMDFLGVYEKQTEAFAHWGREFEGWRIREALVETVDHVVSEDAGVAQRINSNVYIPGASGTISNASNGSIDSWGQPVFGTGEIAAAGSNGNVNWEQLVAEVMYDTMATASSGQCTLANLRSLSYYAKVIKKIEPLSNGTYVMTIPSNCLKSLKDTSTGQAGELFFQTKQETGNEFSHTWKVAQVDDLILYSDNRFPTLTIGGTPGSGTGTLTPYYVKPGNDDERITNNSLSPFVVSTAQHASCGVLMGRAAIAKWEVDAPHSEMEYSNYGKRKGTGIFGMSGYTTVEFDNDAGWTAGHSLNGVSVARKNIGSILVPFRNPSL